VAGERDDLVRERPQRFPRDERSAQHCELGLARPCELLGRRVEQKWRERLAQRAERSVSLG